MNIFNEAIKYINEAIYIPNSLIITNCKEEEHNLDYGAGAFNLNTMSIRFRVAKITPKKIGQFVAFYEKNKDNKNEPYEYSTFPDFLVVNTFTSENAGQFIFPKEILREKGILKTDSKVGKMAIRVYPSWDTPASKQAIATQRWQLQYFVDISKIDNRKILDLYSCNSIAK